MNDNNNKLQTMHKGGYRIAEYKKTDTEPYHAMLVRKHIEQLNKKK